MKLNFSLHEFRNFPSDDVADTNFRMFLCLGANTLHNQGNVDNGQRWEPNPR